MGGEDRVILASGDRGASEDQNLPLMNADDTDRLKPAPNWDASCKSFRSWDDPWGVEELDRVIW